MEPSELKFSSIIGHERPGTILKRAVAGGTLAHAYLLSGQDGIGKRLTALATAAAANCPQRGQDGGCGACPSCRKTAQGSHLDVHLLMPDGDDIKIDQVREMQSSLALRPFEGAKKFLIVDGADAMNDAAANALLKTLEEPPGESVIILVSSRPNTLLATIRSRCQEVRFQPLPRPVLARLLRDRRGLSEEDAWFIAALAGGSVGSALLMDAAAERGRRAEFAALLEDLNAADDARIVALAGAAAKERDRLDRLIDLGIERFRDLAVLAATGDPQLLVHSATADGTGTRETLGSFIRKLDLFTESRANLERHVNGSLIAERLFFTLGRS